MRFALPTQARSSRRGLSIVEVMIGLTITAMLLVGVSAAYCASADAVAGNDNFFLATQSARVTMTQVLTEVRRADSVVTAPSNDSIIVTRDPDLAVSQGAAKEQSREFKYDPASKKVTLKIYYKNPDGTTFTSPLYTMADYVEQATFGPPDTANSIEVRVPLTLVVKYAGNTVRLTGTAGPRRVSQN
jgi:Tfp pilus assembly protein PilW